MVRMVRLRKRSNVMSIDELTTLNLGCNMTANGISAVSQSVTRIVPLPLTVIVASAGLTSAGVRDCMKRYWLLCQGLTL